MYSELALRKHCSEKGLMRQWSKTKKRPMESQLKQALRSCGPQRLELTLTSRPQSISNAHIQSLRDSQRYLHASLEIVLKLDADQG
jgi:hypothetical protein